MHYSVFVVFPKPCEEDGDNIEGAIEHALYPFGEGREWDWYQIGGRWTGYFDGYDPEKDPDNIENCIRCEGIGQRDGQECVQCKGTGKDVKWPTQWKKHNGDVVPIEKIGDKTPYAVVFPVTDNKCGYNWVSREEWVQDKEEKFGGKMIPVASFDDLIKELPSKFPNHLVAIVDCHN